MAGKSQFEIDGGLTNYYNIMIWLKAFAKYGTTKISITIAAGEKVSSFIYKLDLEHQKALDMNEAYSFDRASAIAAIKSAQRRLQRYIGISPKGLVLFSGTNFEDEKETVMTFEWPAFNKPITKSVFFCDNEFHLEIFNDLRTEGHETTGKGIMEEDSSENRNNETTGRGIMEEDSSENRNNE